MQTTRPQVLPGATARLDGGEALAVSAPGRGPGAPEPVGPDSLFGVPRLQTNPSRWGGENWGAFVEALQSAGVEVREDRATKAAFVTDAGGLSFGAPHGVVTARSADAVATVLRAAQKFRVPVTTRGGGLTTEGESVAFGGLALDMTGMSRLKSIDREHMTARVEAGIFWHSLAEALRRHGLDYLSAPLNFTSTVGGTLGVGGIDVNACKWGCSADHAVALQVVTPTGEIVECVPGEELFDRVILGYGQFGVICEATLRIRPYTPCSMHYLFYDDLKACVEDYQNVVRSGATDYAGILTMNDRAMNLLVAFDDDARDERFMKEWRPKLRGLSRAKFAARAVAHYGPRPWRWAEGFWVAKRASMLLPEFHRPEFVRGNKLLDRTAVFSRAVWNHWGNRQMVIPDLATNEAKFVEACLRGAAVCRKFFGRFTLYAVAIRIFEENRARYELSAIPPDAKDFAYGCEFEPMFRAGEYSRDHMQAFKNAIYDVGLSLGGSYYRFGGAMKSYIRRMFGDALVDRHLEMKRAADPAMILNADVIF